MAVTNASTRRTTSVNAFTGLTYIDTVIGTAAGNGLFSVIVEVEAERLGRTICKYQSKAFVDGAVVAEAKLMCAIRPLEK